MAITMTRKGFLGALGGGTVVLWLQACGGGGGYDDDDGPTQCGASSISANHGHTLTIPEADLTSTSDRTYNIQGSATHNHTVTLTVAQLGALRAGQSVDVTSSDNAGHTHMVTSRCT